MSLSDLASLGRGQRRSVAALDQSLVGNIMGTNKGFRLDH